ncbi:flagellar biosynthetic protein FliO [Sporosarcina sp. 179-K 8C2 HS]|uniref:flagellar biosynthetic protein FliO n=1 Tax=Sporosarcina sp. 179-K 8C2 HS TaxID=3142387 RepID=UPI00399F5676
MKLSAILKYSFFFFLAICFFGAIPIETYADADSNDSVSDWYGTDDDGGQGITEVIDKDEPAADRSQDEAAVGLSWWDYTKTLLALLFVVGLLFALLKFINRKNRMFDQHRLMKNVGGLSLGQQKSIQLVVIGDSYYLIGVGDEVRLLKEITNPEEIRTLESYFDEDEVQSPPALVSKLLTMIPQNKGDAIDDRDQPADFKKMFTSKLDELKAERKKHLNRLAEKESRKDE